VKFTVAGNPATKGSTRAVHDRRGRAHVVPDNPRTAGWQQAVAWTAKVAGAKLLAGPVRVEMLFELRRAGDSLHWPVGTPCRYRPDLDKLVRAVLDALTAICYRDDSQVTELIAAKVYGAAPQATITVEPAGGVRMRQEDSDAVKEGQFQESDQREHSDGDAPRQTASPKHRDRHADGGEGAL
jgi:crossover junction endodeoxyribonuclease RusA